MSDYQHRCLTALFRQAAPWLILHPASHHHRASTTTAAFSAIRCRCGRTFSCHPVFTVLQGGLTVRRVSTTAAFPAIRCRCGRTFSCHPVLTVFQGGFTVRHVSTTAAFSAIRCRCGSTFPCHPRLHGAPRRLYGQTCFHNGSVFRDSVPLWHTVVRRARLRRSHFAMSNMLPKFISFIIKDIRFNNLPDPADIAAKRPFSPISSQVQHVSFFRVSDYQVFL